jgi:chromosome partitioning protein
MSSVIAIVNQKGGVGKTTLAVHLGVALARRDKRVVIVDGDPQGNTTSWLLDGDLSQAGLFDLLVVGKALGLCVRPSRRWKLGILPGNGRTAEAMIFLAAMGRPNTTIADALRPLARMADFVLLDMPPSRAAGFSEMLFTADWVIIPTQLERLALEGVSLMAETVAQLSQAQGRGPRLLGVVPNMVRYTREHREQLEQLVDVFGPVVWPPIPLSVRVAEASAYGDVLFDMAPGEKVTQAVLKVVDRLLGALGESLPAGKEGAI